MSDLISRQDALAKIRTRLQDWAAYGNEEYRRGLYACEDMILSLPSAEAVQGEWIDYVGKDLGIEGQWLRDDGKTVFVQCDQCDSIFVRNLMTHTNFCPNCGARMRGEEE